MIQIQVFNTDSTHIDDALVTENVHADESVYAALQRMFADFTPDAGDVIRIVEVEKL